MIKFIFLATLCFALQAEVIVDTAKTARLGRILKTNGEVVVLKNGVQHIVSQIGGHIEKYFVKEGDEVQKGDKIALIKSLSLAGLTSKYLALQKEMTSLKKRLENAKALLRQGLFSVSDFEKLKVSYQKVKENFDAIKTKLALLGLENITKIQDRFILRAHTSGVVNKILKQLHGNVTPLEPVVEIIGPNNRYVVGFVSVEEALNLPKRVEGEFILGQNRYEVHFIKLMPKVDPVTTQAKLLFSLDKPLLIGAFGELHIQTPPLKEYVVVDRDALTMFEGEWVVFVPEKEKFVPQVVQPLLFWRNLVAVDGMKAGQKYVKKGVYEVKSLLLKNELGEE